MPALNFKKQFAEAVEHGNKRQTVRAPRKDGRPHAKVGDTLKLYTGMRTKQCRLLATATVTHIDRIRIEPMCMFLNGSFMPVFDACQTDDGFAVADGFKNFMDMSLWFATVHGLPFEGFVIHWDAPR